MSGGLWHGQIVDSIPINVEIADGLQVTMGIRPEYLLLNHGTIPAKIEKITPFYSERYQLLEIQLGDMLYQMKADFEETLSKRADNSNRLQSRRCTLFRYENGQAIRLIKRNQSIQIIQQSKANAVYFAEFRQIRKVSICISIGNNTLRKHRSHTG